ncbi:MAG: OmpH family outer membrane protein [Chitinophagaceae bacterium]|nr:OmpH family outer membrane protein [Chitinophagaceae bacterium]
MKLIFSNKWLSYALLILSFALAVTLSLSIFLYWTRPKIAYVNTITLFQDFKQKKELEKQFGTIEKEQKLVLDSLKMKFSFKSQQLEQLKKSEDAYRNTAGDAVAIREEYYKKEKEFTENNKVLADQYNLKIWNQLNAYIKEYGISHDYTYIHGVKGDGAILYAEEGDDITKEVTVYVNEKFEGK